ncbi:hypothetical protein [Paraburkholderia sp. Cpub6]|uniref:hypothetical protein n=1 Tax=Paraburkholderia sp. Cpub6 TaxID=2723094 RepID=UPI00160D9506|nr:hypothetical protein [Paraburkholderia sp. Cpub6]MBB5462906.1 hypothetical protein [Paraburkholderia sp. Cpub6]
MTDEEALSKVRGAFRSVKKEVGDNKHAIREVLKTRRDEDRDLFEAFKQVGQLMQRTQQGH